MMRFAAAILAALSAAPAAASEPVLSDAYGRPMTVGAAADARDGWAAAPVAPEVAVALFDKLCLATSDEAGFVAAAEAAGLTRDDVALPAAGKAAATSVVTFRSPGLAASFWAGDSATLVGRLSAIRDRGVVVVGPVSAKRLASRQCNLSLRTTSIPSGEPLAAALTARAGVQPVKVVLKPGFADGNWALTNGAPRTLSFSAVDLTKAEQLVHITIFSRN